MFSDERFMDEAIKQAERAYEAGEVPIGAIIVHENKIIARAHNQMEQLKDPTAHAEIIAITQAAASFDDWRLENTVLYTTVEPCIMCSGAISLARVEKVIYGTDDANGGGCGSVIDIAKTTWVGHKPEIVKGLKQEICRDLMKSFFKERRSKRN